MRPRRFMLAIDFDGTIVEHRYPKIGTELKNALYFLKKLKDDGHLLILWTCREGKELQEAVDYCKGRGVTFDAVNENIVPMGDTIAKSKILADYYIDDRNLETNLNWNYIYKKVQELSNK